MERERLEGRPGQALAATHCTGVRRNRPDSVEQAAVVIGDDASDEHAVTVQRRLVSRRRCVCTRRQKGGESHTRTQ